MTSRQQATPLKVHRSRTLPRPSEKLRRVYPSSLVGRTGHPIQISMSPPLGYHRILIQVLDRSAVLDQDAQHSTADVEPVDEATLIEQRRKRREAIMAKHKTQSNPLLVQALTASNTSTPPSDSLPETPGSVSQVPGELNFQTDWVALTFARHDTSLTSGNSK